MLKKKDMTHNIRKINGYKEREKTINLNCFKKIFDMSQSMGK